MWPFSGRNRFCKYLSSWWTELTNDRYSLYLYIHMYKNGSKNYASNTNQMAKYESPEETWGF